MPLHCLYFKWPLASLLSHANARTLNLVLVAGQWGVLAPPVGPDSQAALLPTVRALQCKAVDRRASARDSVRQDQAVTVQCTHTACNRQALDTHFHAAKSHESCAVPSSVDLSSTPGDRPAVGGRRPLFAGVYAQAGRAVAALQCSTMATQEQIASGGYIVACLPLTVVWYSVCVPASRILAGQGRGLIRPTASLKATCKHDCCCTFLLKGDSRVSTLFKC